MDGDGPTPPRLWSLVILVYNVALGAEATRQEHTYLSIVKSTFLRKHAWHQTTMTLTYFNAESGEPGLYPSNRKQLWYLSEAKKKTCRSLLQTKRLIPGRARPRLQIAKRFVDRIFACTTPIALARIVHLVHDIATYPVLSFAFQLAYRGLVTRRSFDPILDMSLDEWFSMTFLYWILCQECTSWVLFPNA
jgi:hypothetical protein